MKCYELVYLHLHLHCILAILQLSYKYFKSCWFDSAAFCQDKQGKQCLVCQIFKIDINVSKYSDLTPFNTDSAIMKLLTCQFVCASSLYVTAIFWLELGEPRGQRRYSGVLHTCIADKTLAFDSKMRRDHSTRQAAAGSLFTVLTSKLWGIHNDNIQNHP